MRKTLIVVPRGVERKSAAAPQTITSEWGMRSWLHIAAISTHFVSAVVLASLLLSREWQDVLFPTYITVPKWDPPLLAASVPGTEFRDTVIALGPPQDSGLGSLSVGWSIFTFFVMSFLFELAEFLCVLFGEITAAYTLRWVEYSVSASVVLMVVAMQVGFWDARGIVGLAGLSATCMFCGLIGELALNSAPHPNIAVAAVSWAAGFVAVANAWAQIWWTFAEAYTSETPDFVIAIVVVECFFWLCFAAVQLVQIIRGLSSQSVVIWYSGLSVLSKSVLGWVVVSQVIANSS